MEAPEDTGTILTSQEQSWREQAEQEGYSCQCDMGRCSILREKVQNFMEH